MTETARLVMAADSSQVRSATKDLQTMAKEGKSTEGVLTGLGRTLAAVGAGALAGKFLGAIIRNTMEAEDALRQLEARLKSTGGVSGQTVDSVLALSAALQDQTRFGDEAITSAQNLLLTFTKIQGDIFPKAVTAILDVSTAMGTDLNSAALQVGKALNAPIEGLTALSRAGVQFTDDQKAVIKALVEAGREAEAQEMILKELETQMGGAAVAARDTLGGALDGLKNAFGDLLEGDTGGDGVRGTKDAIEDLTSLLKSPDVKQAFAGITESVVVLAGKIAELTTQGYGFTKWVAESLAAAVNGPATDDLVRLDTAIEDIQNRLEKRKQNPGRVGLFADTTEELEAQLAALKVQRAAADQLAQDAASAAAAANIAAQNAPAPVATPRDPLPTIVDPEAARAAARKLKEEQRAAAEAARDLAAAQGELNGLLLDQAGALGGEVVQAALAYKAEMESIMEVENELIRLGKLDEEQQLKLNLAREQANELYQEELAALDAKLTPTEQLISDLEFELSLMGMTNAEREKAIALRRLEGEATEEQSAKIGELLDNLREEGEEIAALDRVRNEFSSFFQDLVKNGESALDRLQERILDMVLQNLGDQLAESLFGAFGTNQTGSAGGGIAGFFSTLFSSWGGGRASGGRAARGKVHEVAEQGPELLDMGGKTYLLTGDRDGHITPNQNVAGDTYNNFTQNITVPINTEQRTAKQVGAGAYRGAASFIQRNR
jgi:hypothetical protein